MASTREAWFKCVLGDDELLFRRLLGGEELGRLPEYRLELMRSQKLSRIAPADLLGTKATVKLLRANEQYRYIDGWITAVELGGAVGRFDTYQLELRPWLWHLTLGADCRIFQDKNPVEIIKAVFADYSSAEFDLSKISGTPRTRPYCVQYRESDFNFVSRLMEEEGIWYYFSHADGRHTLVLANGPSGQVALPEGQLAWAHSQSDEHVREDIISQWRKKQQLRSLKFIHDDYDHESPTTALLKSEQRSVGYATPGDLEVYDWPGSYAFPGDSNNSSQGTAAAKLAVKRLETGHVVVSAVSPCRSIGAGMTFGFKDHPYDAGDYLVTAASLSFDAGDEEAGESTRGDGFKARLRLVPKATPFATEALTRKPIVQGPQTAVVVGPAGDEIHVDRLGRIKVWFRWDRVGPKNERSTCYIRVATPWASKNYGMITTPRIGDEVVVSFLEGNPDRPLITGSVYNNDLPPPYPLPAQATVSGTRSRSSKGGGADNFNELRFDDKAGAEYVWLQAEKDFHRRVKHDATDEVARNNQVEIGKNHTAAVGEAYDLKVGKTAKIEIGTDANAKVLGDLNLAVDGGTGLKVGAGLDIKSNGALAVTSGAAMDVNASASLTISASARKKNDVCGLISNSALPDAVLAPAIAMPLEPVAASGYVGTRGGAMLAGLWAPP